MCLSDLSIVMKLYLFLLVTCIVFLLMHKNGSYLLEIWKIKLVVKNISCISQNKVILIHQGTIHTSIKWYISIISIDTTQGIIDASTLSLCLSCKQGAEIILVYLQL